MTRASTFVFGTAHPTALVRRGSLAAPALVALSAVAQAGQLPYIGVQFNGPDNNGTPPALSATTIAGVVPQSHFNADSSVSDTIASLNNANGAATSVSLTYSAQSSWTTGTSAVGPNGASGSPLQNGDPTLLDGEDKMNPGGGAAVYTLTGLPNHAYNLIVYGVNDAGGTTSLSTVTVGTSVNSLSLYNLDQTGSTWNGTPTYVNGGSATQAGATTLGNYVEFLGVHPVGGEIQFTHAWVSGGNSYSSVNGFQLVTPEPSSFLLCGLGTLGLGFAAWRRRRKV